MCLSVVAQLGECLRVKADIVFAGNTQCNPYLSALEAFVKMRYTNRRYLYLCHCDAALYHRNLCIEKYGKAPDVQLGGNLSATFSYIPQPLDYILVELLKNALRYVCTDVLLISQFSLLPFQCCFKTITKIS